MSIQEQVVEDLKTLSEAELKQVAEYLEFLKSRAQGESASISDEKQLAALYAEFADEDRRLAEQGIAGYAENLEKEDAR